MFGSTEREFVVVTEVVISLELLFAALVKRVGVNEDSVSVVIVFETSKGDATSYKEGKNVILGVECCYHN